MMGHLHLIRHGTTEANKARKYYGSTDIPLANEGVNAIVEFATAGIYPKADSASCYTTGLLRTEQTFFLIYGNREHQQIPELQEYDFGDFEMKTHNELIQHPDYTAWASDEQGALACPNGESTLEFKERVGAGLSQILQEHMGSDEQDRQSILVCHGGVISVIMGIFFPDVEKNIFQWQPNPGRGYSIVIQEGEAVSYKDI